MVYPIVSTNNIFYSSSNHQASLPALGSSDGTSSSGGWASAAFSTTSLAPSSKPSPSKTGETPFMTTPSASSTSSHSSEEESASVSLLRFESFAGRSNGHKGPLLPYDKFDTNTLFKKTVIYFHIYKTSYYS